jgi:hypothetical protein
METHGRQSGDVNFRCIIQLFGSLGPAAIAGNAITLPKSRPIVNPFLPNLENFF